MNWLFGNEDSRTGTEQLIDAGQTFALGAAGEGVGRVVSAGGKMALDAGKNAINRRVIGATDAMDDVAKIQQRVQDMRSIGIEPTPGMVSGSERQALLEHAIKPTKTGQQIEARIKDAFAKQGEAFNTVVDGMTGGKAPMSKAEIGEALRAQTEAAKKAGFARSEQLYDDVAAKITSPASANHTATFLKNLGDERAAMGEFEVLNRGAQTDQAIKQATAIVNDAQKGMSFDKLKQARSLIGKTAANETDPVMKGHLDSLYTSLTKDMEETALASGPEAKQAWQKANNQFRRLVDPEKGFGKGSVADAILNKDTDKVFDFVFNNRKNGGNQIAAARRAVIRSEGGKQAWDEGMGSIIHRLGTKTTEDGDVFDPTTFFKNWKKESFSDEAKNAMFKGTKNEQFQQDLDTLSRIADNMKRYNGFDNHSNTAKHQTVLETMNPLSRKNIYATAIGSAVYAADPITGLGPIALRAAGKGVQKGYKAYQGKLLTSPETVNWLANIGKAEMQKGGLKAHMTKLRGIGSSTKDQALAIAINEFVKDLGYFEDDN
ncbi:DUF4197 family protein [Sinorhizobium psoraleae]|uniref:Uncharacterized protein n=1 Tax=Sinorhizobium psoraleae TaxID=520838 RepID=A0ABT4KDK3_9HYPH|nr:DUF4197 family protein [Sinorhizobium psoraleae]MCZ4089067.1 hypothetical protein [Sinorhizobium psoraleae]